MNGHIPKMRALILVLGALMAVALTVRMIMFYS